ncbi:MAG: molybdopterin oxidoreductase family protein [Acidimicrobiia bacterium]
MARPPVTEEELVARYGPHLNEAPPGGWNADLEIDREVKTHCCFCGQQCGIILKVHANEVVGFEPWYEFPFNEGKLCPKGVKRYLQGNHPDRLLEPLERTDDGFAPVTWDTALDRVASEIRRIQAAYGPNSFAVLNGASLTSEKAYLVGKFARLAVGTANLDYNGRLCMVSAGHGYTKAFGVDRAPNPWSDLPLADVIFVIGANIAECAPITTSYVWRSRDRGGKLIVADPRVTPLARTADVFLGLRPGTDSALLGTMLQVMITRDWLDHDFIDAHTEGFEAAVEAVRDSTPAWGADITGVPAARIEEAAEMWATAATGMILHARGLEHHTSGVDNVSAAINLALAAGRIGRPGCGPCMVTGQGNGQGAREHGGKSEQLPGMRKIEDPEARAYIAEVWGCTDEELRHQGYSAEELIWAIDRGEVKGLLSICFNPVVSLPDSNTTRRALDKLEFFGIVDFFLSETAFHADVVLPGSLHEEDEGVVATVEGRVVKVNEAIPPPGNARRDWEIFCDLAERLDAGRYFEFENVREIFDEMALASKGGIADYSGMTWDRLEDEMGIFWPCPEPGHPGTPRLFEDLRFNTPSGRARFVPVTFKPPAEVVDGEYPIWYTTGRVISQYLSGTQTRRIGPLVHQYPQPLCEIHPRLAEQHGITTGDLVTVTSRRGSITVAASVVSTIRPDTVFIPYHWGGKLAANQLTNPALDPESKIPEFKVCAVRIERTREGGSVTDERELDLRSGDA